MIKLETEIGKKTSWTPGNGYVSFGPGVRLVRRSFLDKLVEYVKNIEQAEITTIGAVFFQKEAIFPRHKFKEIYSNPATRNIEKAEYVVINKNAIIEQLSRMGTSMWYLDSATNIWLSSTGGAKKEQFINSTPAQKT